MGRTDFFSYYKHNNAIYTAYLLDAVGYSLVIACFALRGFQVNVLF